MYFDRNTLLSSDETLWRFHHSIENWIAYLPHVSRKMPQVHKRISARNTRICCWLSSHIAVKDLSALSDRFRTDADHVPSVLGTLSCQPPNTLGRNQLHIDLFRCIREILDTSTQKENASFCLNQCTMHINWQSGDDTFLQTGFYMMKKVRLCHRYFLCCYQ